MIGLLTWPTYGTWFAGRGRGWVDATARGPLRRLPEPRRRGRPSRQRWPTVGLDADQRAVVIEDLKRVAALREFELLLAVAAEDHVHVLLGCAADRDIHRLVQLVKGSLSRTLSVAGRAPQPPPSLPHMKWWSRQYSFRTIADRASLECALADLEAHDPKRTVRFKSVAPISFPDATASREPAP